jgi:N-formylglutamate deformylase
MILHIPHSSKVIPSEIRNTFLLSDDELQHELLYMTDAFTDELFTGNENDQWIVFPISRLVVDPERFKDDNQEPMAQKGMGAVYTSTSSGKILRRVLANNEREALLKKYYDPHQECLSIMVKHQLDIKQECLIVDCHSFPSKPLPYEYDQLKNRPDICIGTDLFHTPTWLSNEVVGLFEKFGYSICLNRPFCGTFVPNTYYQKKSRVYSIMLEINRKLYMNEEYGNKHHGFHTLHNHLSSIIKTMTDL